MINAVRTLLLNRPAASVFDPTLAGEEYVAGDFMPRKLPADLDRAHRYLLGFKPDRLYANYRMRQIMELLHSTELEEFVYTLDNRVTYLPFTDTDMFNDTFGIVVEQYDGMGDAQLTVHGTPEADDGLGTTTQSWRLYVNGDTATIDRLTAPLKTVTQTFTVTGGLSSYVSLPNSSLRCRFPGMATTGTGWIVTAKARPQVDLTARLNNFIAAIDTTSHSTIFADTTEPVATLRAVYNDHPLFAYKASAALLAMALFMHQLPQDV
jgi:hypothetical protein